MTGQVVVEQRLDLPAYFDPPEIQVSASTPSTHDPKVQHAPVPPEQRVSVQGIPFPRKNPPVSSQTY